MHNLYISYEDTRPYLLRLDPKEWAAEQFKDVPKHIYPMTTVYSDLGASTYYVDPVTGKMRFVPNRMQSVHDDLVKRVNACVDAKYSYLPIRTAIINGMADIIQEELDASLACRAKP